MARIYDGKARMYILANTFEAFIGALYLDRGYEKAEKIINQEIISKLPDILKNESWKDFKSQFQEKAQEKVRVTPTYETVKEWGPDHAKHFVIGVYLGDELVAKGEGSSKQEAEEKAAKNALRIKNW